MKQAGFTTALNRSFKTFMSHCEREDSQTGQDQRSCGTMIKHEQELNTPFDDDRRRCQCTHIIDSEAGLMVVVTASA